MLRLALRFLPLIALAPTLGGLCAAADQKEQRHSFKLRLLAHLDMEIQDNKQTVDGDTELAYSWSRQGAERTLQFDTAVVKGTHNGNSVLDTFMSRTKVANTADGKTDEVPFEKADEAMKAKLRDTFETPICKLKVGENGKEIKRDMLARAGAKEFLDQGMIANALVFHPPFHRGAKEWTAPGKVSMGNGGYAEDRLTYKLVGGEGRQTVKVTGTLTNEAYKFPDKPVTIKNAKYVIDGEQTYDPALGEWVAGNLKIEVSFDMAIGDTAAATAKGTMKVSLEKVGDKK